MSKSRRENRGELGFALQENYAMLSHIKIVFSQKNVQQGKILISLQVLSYIQIVLCGRKCTALMKECLE